MVGFLTSSYRKTGFGLLNFCHFRVQLRFCAVLQGESKVLVDAFGLVSMVAMTPLITIQILGFKAVVTKRVREKVAMKRILGADDKQIINFL